VLRFYGILFPLRGIPLAPPPLRGDPACPTPFAGASRLPQRSLASVALRFAGASRSPRPLASVALHFAGASRSPPPPLRGDPACPTPFAGGSRLPQRSLASVALRLRGRPARPRTPRLGLAAPDPARMSRGRWLRGGACLHIPIDWGDCGSYCSFGDATDRETRWIARDATDRTRRGSRETRWIARDAMDRTRRGSRETQIA
jgi:hypothetical protein